ncbi:MAG TPA: GNAT family N-acetyltransferase [Candidatus Dormibacteraeota bacterium]|nr:GNAT family N-acetyltransferase [Candidatus Dormibacteraeota bacterium]
MSVEIRTLRADEVDAWIRAEAPRWGETYTPERLALWGATIETERTLAAVDAGRLVGGATIMTSSLGLPAGRVPAAGVTWVSVHPTHRRRGLLRSMMTRLLGDAAERGTEPVAMLLASESGIYRRFGYGSAAPCAGVEIATAASRFARPHTPSGRVELVDLDAFLEVAPAVYRRLTESGEGIPGSIGRPDAYWRAHAGDPLHGEGTGERLYALHHGARGVDGYVMYRLQPRWTHHLPDYTLRVDELLAEPGDAGATLWRYVLDHDLVRSVSAVWRPVDEPVVHLLAEPRAWRRHIVDDLWVCILDVRRALTARRYGVSDSLVLDVRDGGVPGVAGRWRLTGGPDGAECAPSTESADVALDAAALGSLLCGGVRVAPLAGAGLVEELTPGAIARADRMFGWHLIPWNLGEF